MTDLEREADGNISDRDRFMSTTYSYKIACGVCGTHLHNIPAMYERVNIDWRCSKCLRRDKPALEDQAG